MRSLELKRYKALNQLAESGGIVIFGGSDDKDIPLCELRQAFALQSKLYNRSVTDLSIDEAVELYDTCVSPLSPETVLLHIGDADLDLFQEDSSEFDRKYLRLIDHIKTLCKKCRIAVISLRNPENAPDIAEINKHLKYIADSEQCDFEDIATKRVWNPKETMDVVSFVYSTGFVRPLKTHKPIYDLVKILFCYE